MLPQEYLWDDSTGIARLLVPTTLIAVLSWSKNHTTQNLSLMKFLISLPLMISASLMACLSSVSAHVSVGGDRTFNLGGPIDGATFINDVRTVSSGFGWADGTDDNWGDSHRLTAFKFTLATIQTVTISVARRDFVGQTGANLSLLPGFSLYQTPLWLNSTHDTGPATRSYLTGLFGTTATGEIFADDNSNGIWNVGETFTDANGNGVYDGPGIDGSGKKGAFRALDRWKVYHDSVGGAEMDFNSIIGHAADGISANYGSANGINGDGVADGFVTATFELAAGDYYLFVGGANYDAQLTEAPVFGVNGNAFPTYGIEVTVSSVPEPSTTAFLALGLGGLAFARRKRS